jgi:protein SCO1/2
VNHLSDPSRRFLIIAVLFAAPPLISSCHRSKPPATTRYHFTGRIVSIDHQAQTALVDGDLVQGYMEAMAMTYKFKPASTILQLAPGDAISADLVVVDHDPRDETTEQEYWLENVKVTGHAQSPPARGANSLHMPAPGEDVPDFAFTNQDGKRVSLRQYRGKVLFMTFIYTRCPFPDFCPRMSSNFNEIYQQLGTNPALAGAHLLSISFDPQRDTPKVLREYAYSVAHTKAASLFRSWEFVAPKDSDLPKIADFFALTVKPEGGTITHNLSTAVIGPDGKIVSWYHGGDWRISDLIKDAADARSRAVGL